MTRLSREHFSKVLDKYLISTCCIGYEDLPDVVMIDDYWDEGMSVESFKAAIQDCAQDILDNSGYNIYLDEI